MTKPLQFCLTIAIFASTAIGLSHAQESKTGLIDFARVQKEYKRSAIERASFEEKRIAARKPLDDFQDELKKLVDLQRQAQAQLNDPTLSNSRKDALVVEGKDRATKIRAVQQEMVKSEQAIVGQLEQLAVKTQTSITGDIQSKIAELAKAKGLTLVLNSSFGLNGVPVVPYVSTDAYAEFTDEVIAALNK